MEPRLSPPVDEKLERVTSYVDNIALEDLAYEIQSYGLDEKVKETILELEIPNANDFVQETIQNGNLKFLLRIVSKIQLMKLENFWLIKYTGWTNNGIVRSKKRNGK